MSEALPISESFRELAGLHDAPVTLVASLVRHCRIPHRGGEAPVPEEIRDIDEIEAGIRRMNATRMTEGMRIRSP